MKVSVTRFKYYYTYGMYRMKYTLSHLGSSFFFNSSNAKMKIRKIFKFAIYDK